MLPRELLVLLLGAVSFVQAQPSLRPRASLSLSNRTTTRPIPSTATRTPVTLSSALSSTSLSNPIKLSKDPGRSAVCCFVVQDTISEEWWDEFSTTSTYGLVNVTAVTTYLTKGPDGLGTIVGSNSSVTVANTSFVFSYNVGVNPLATLFNPAPGPTETDSPLTGIATTTGGELVKSPAAFYVYNSVKIITAAAVTDRDKNIMCATSSRFDNINSNAEAYFGGSSIAGQTVSKSVYTTVVSRTLTFLEPTIFTTTPTTTTTLTSLSTYYTDSDGAIVTPPPRQPGVIISLTEPFIYQPPWGETGALEPTPKCERGSHSEQYGYIPQTLLDFLVQNPAYSAQYPGLAGCVPGGPSLLFGNCLLATHSTPSNPLPSTVAIPAGEGLTSSATVYVMPNIVATPAPPDSILGDTQRTSPPAGPVQSLPPNANQDPPPNSIGGIINSIIGGQTPPGQPDGPFSTQIIGGTQVLVIPGPTNIPISNVPPGLEGSVTVIGGSTFLSIPAATTLPNPPSNPLPNPGGVFSSSIVGGTTVLVIPQTTIPLAQAPSGLQGSTITQNGTPFLVIPSATTIPLPANPNPLAGALGAISTTIINGTPYLLIPSPLPAPPLPGSLTTISGIAELILPGPTTIPLSELSGLDVGGRTTVIGGITEVVLSSGMTVALKTGSSASVGVSVSVLTTTIVVMSASPTAAKKNVGGKLDAGWKWLAGSLCVVAFVLV